MDFDDLLVLWLKLLQDHAECANITNADFNSSSWTNTRTRTNSRAT